MKCDLYDENIAIKEKGLVKKLISKLLRKPFLIFMKPFVAYQNSMNSEFTNNINSLLEHNHVLQEKTEKTERELLDTKNKITSMQEELVCVKEHLDNTLEYFKTYNQKKENDIGAMARQIMLAKWKILDHIDCPPQELTCKICGKTHPINEYKTIESECIFNGGKLVRYICPDCGVIFGPTKFLQQGQKGIDEDYWVHYLGYSEGNSFEKEERAFFMLKPQKDKVYLNYGCGKWSKSMQNLRKEGYNVYGYEPYAPEIDNPYMITSKAELQKMRFDGIYSNDVLEHLIDPIKELRFMSSLLINKESKMSHCTSCYTYKYEYTRFHTHFFVGKSLNVLTARSGLKIIDQINDLEKKDFICYVYSPIIARENVFGNLLENMIELHNAKKFDDHIRIGEDGCICGPYISIPKGRYVFKLNTNNTLKNVAIKITADMGKKIIWEGNSSIKEISFELEQFERDVEIVINSNGCVLDILSIELIRC